MIDKLFLCKECNEIFNITRFDKNPVAFSLTFNCNQQNKKGNENEDPYLKHKGHKLERLKPLSNTFISRGDYWEPLREIFFEAVQGKDRVVIRRWRKNIMESMQYDLIPGSLKITLEAIELQEKEIRKEWQRVMPETLQEKFNLFFTVLKEMLPKINLNKNSPLTFPSSNPLIFYRRFKQKEIQMILRKLKSFVARDELEVIQRFLSDQNQMDGVIPLRIKKSFFIERTDEQEVSNKKIDSLLPSPIKNSFEQIRNVGYQI